MILGHELEWVWATFTGGADNGQGFVERRRRKAWAQHNERLEARERLADL